MLRRGVHPVIRIGSALAVVAVTCGTAQAQLRNCEDPGPSDVFKIFVDEVRTAGGPPSSAAAQAKLQTIHRFLYENLRATSGENASVRNCGNRYPNDPGDFNSREFDGLNFLRVVLEVWGVVDDPAKGSGSLGFVLIPAHDLTPPAVYVVPSANLLNSLRQGKQMTAFAPLVLGIRQYQNRNYADAVGLLCAGTQQLTTVAAGQSALGGGAFQSRQQELMKKVREITDTAVKEARKTPGSPFLTWTPANDGTFKCLQ